MEQGDDPYKILGVSTTASHDEIRKCYHKLALKNHPDRQKTDEARGKAQQVFARISNAYELVGDDDHRREYDLQQKEEDGGGFDNSASYDIPTPGVSSTSTSTKSTSTSTSTKATAPSKRSTKKKKAKPMNFNDPYDVFKWAFEEQFGIEYPGAKYDHIEGLEPAPRKALKDSDNKKKKKLLLIKDTTTSFRNMFRRGDPADKQTSTTANEEEPSKPEQPKTKKLSSSSQALVKRSKDNKKNQQIVKREEPAGNNRPDSMETTTRTIKHKNGKEETITETTMTRPDGSTETFQHTNNAGASQEPWAKKNIGRLTNGKSSGNTDKPKMLTASTTSKGKQRLLTNGAKPQKQRLLANGK